MWEYWQHQRRIHAVNRYAFAAMLEQAALLLFNASEFWYKWSPQRRIKLVQAGHWMLDSATTVRHNCWHSLQHFVGENMELNMHFAVQARMPVRTYKEKSKIECADGAKFLTTAAFNLLKWLLPHIEIVRKKDHQFSIAHLEEVLEMLHDSNCIYHNLDVGYAPLSKLAICGIYLECCTIAYLQADLESNYLRKQPSWKRSVKIPGSKKLEKMAQELSISVDELREAYSSKYSSWWKIQQIYHNEAQKWMNIYVKENISKVTWNEMGMSIYIGTPYADGSTEVFGEEALGIAEAVSRIMITEMTSWLQRSKPNTFVDLPQIT